MSRRPPQASLLHPLRWNLPEGWADGAGAVALALCWVIGLGATEAAAQAVRLVGSVYDRDGAVPAALVRLRAAEGLSFEETSGEDGSFAFAQLDPGVYEVEVTADGFRPSLGTASLVPSAGSSLRLDVELRRLDEQAPAGVESLPQVTVRRWLELGNDLLAQGRNAAARAEFEKALPWLDAADQAQTHRAIARCRWLEGDVDGTVGELELALAAELRSGVAAEDLERGDTFQLLRTLLEQLQRLPELPARRAAALALSSKPTEREAADAANVEPAGPGAPPSAPVAKPMQAHEVGRLVVEVPGSAQAPSLDELKERLGEFHFPAQSHPEPMDLAGEQLALYVPPAYASETVAQRSEDPWGLFVWVSPVGDGSLWPQPELEKVLADRRLIWVGAQRSGNQRASWQRVALALVAAQQVVAHYDVNPREVFVGGYSGGGRVASALAWKWPEVFAGGVFWFGSDFYENVPVPYRPGAHWAARFPKPTRAQERLLKSHRFVFVTGDLDFNRSETRVVSEMARERGYEGAVFLRIPKANHYFGLGPEWLGRALDEVSGRSKP